MRGGENGTWYYSDSPSHSDHDTTTTTTQKTVDKVARKKKSSFAKKKRSAVNLDKRFDDLGSSAIRRLAYMAGVAAMSSDVYSKVKEVMRTLFREVVPRAAIVASHSHRLRIKTQDVIEAVRIARGQTVLLQNVYPTGAEGEFRRCKTFESTTRPGNKARDDRSRLGPTNDYDDNDDSEYHDDDDDTPDFSNTESLVESETSSSSPEKSGKIKREETFADGPKKTNPKKKSRTVSKIKHYQKTSTECLHFPRAVFEDLARWYASETIPDVQFTGNALGLLQVVVEASVVRVLEGAYSMAVTVAERKKLRAKDIGIAQHVVETIVGRK
jgi:histone H3/H4